MKLERNGRPAVGEQIEVPGYGLCEVESNADPSIVALRTPSGATVKIGDQALRLALLAANGEDCRPTDDRQKRNHGGTTAQHEARLGAVGEQSAPHNR